MNVLRCDAESRADAADDRARRRHERIRAVIDIEHRALRAFEHHFLAGANLTIDQHRTVRDAIRAQDVRVRK